MSAREQDAVNSNERRYSDGGDPSILDVMDVPLLAAKPGRYQQENWLLDPAQWWARVGDHPWRDLDKLADPPEALWVNGYSTSNGLNDEIPLRLANDLTSSLRLIRVQKLTVSVFSQTSFGRTRRRVQGQFRYLSTDYHLWVTDPAYEEPYKRRKDGDYPLAEAFLTISLSEPFAEAGACYKLVAAIIEPPKSKRS